MRISEIYASLQGESQYAGLPCTLVRTTGCDLRCRYCDTTHAFHGGQELSLDQIMAEVERLGQRFVLLTGGEPMLQRDIATLANRLVEAGYRVALETSGAHALEGMPSQVLRVVDVKTPSSGECERNRWELLPTLRPCDAVKFVLASEADYVWAAEQVRRLGLAEHTEVLFSPVHGELDPKDLARWVVRDRLPVRVNLQLHKYIWGPDSKGV